MYLDVGPKPRLIAVEESTRDLSSAKSVAFATSSPKDASRSGVFAFKLRSAFASHQDFRHLKVEDGPGRPLGRSFRVKLWPTLVFLKDGQEVARVTRPSTLDVLREAMAKIA